MSEPKFKPGDTVIVKHYCTGGKSNREYHRGDEFIILSIDRDMVTLIDGGRVNPDEFHTNNMELVFRPATRAETEALRKLAEAAEGILDSQQIFDVDKMDVRDAVAAWKKAKGE